MMTRFAVVAALLGMLAAGRAEAGFTYSFQQVGANVVVSGSGTLNIAGLQFSAGTSTVGMSASLGTISSGPAPVGTNEFILVYITGPGGFGTASLLASSGSGASMGFDEPKQTQSAIGVPTGYISGNALVSSITFNNQTFATLGLIAGTYVYSYSATQGSPVLDTFTVVVPGAVPEPASLAMLGLGLAGGGVVVRSRRKV